MKIFVYFGLLLLILEYGYKIREGNNVACVCRNVTQSSSELSLIRNTQISVRPLNCV